MKSCKPNIIQGGMGIGVSSWQLARRVAELGEIGVVSGTGIDSVLVREFQEGDPFNRRAVLKEYPDQSIVNDVIDKYYVEGGKAEDEPYDLLPIHRFDPTVRSQKILSLASFSEVRLAQRGHDGFVGINFLAKLKRYNLSAMYGAMLAGVDAIYMGAGIPTEEAKQVPKLANGEQARVRLRVDTTQHENTDEKFHYKLNPSDILEDPPDLDEPDFYPIIASDVLAKILDHKLADEYITGWIIEKPRAGGHNAPPRNKKTDADGNPIYDEKDTVNLKRVRDLGYPFYLAGGYGHPEKLSEALDQGAEGVQVGSLFSLTEESGYPRSTTRDLIKAVLNDDVTVRTDGRISPTGFPFKVLELDGTLAIPEVYEDRTRICDLGYLQEPFLDENGSLRGRCPSEPVDDYVKKGGNREDTRGRGCLCNALMANIGHGQRQKWGEEKPLYTAGDEIETLPFVTEDDPSYTAKDVVDYLYEANLTNQ